jgi:hypothetical protein
VSSYDPTDLPKQQADKREEDARKRVARQQEIGDLKWLMSSPRGRRFVWRLLDLSGPFRLSFDTNAMKMAFQEGNRNMGNQLLNEVMNLCPELYPVMVKEQRNDRDGSGDQSN